MKRLSRALLSAFGLGFLPGPTGTYASAATVAALYALAPLGLGWRSPAVLGALLLGSLVTWLLSTRAQPAGSAGDPSWIVSDEVAGQALALAVGGAIPFASTWAPVASAFLLFRLFDILKPGPVRAAERLPGGLGVLADDLVAGALAGGLVLAAGAVGAFG